MKSVESGWKVWAGSKRGRLVVAVMIVLVAATSCGSLPRTNYYTLRVPPPPGSRDSKTAAVLGIERLDAPEVLRGDRIVYYESATQLNFYEYHRWSSDPATMVRDSIAQRLNQAGIFSDVRLLPARDPVEYLLRGRLLDFEEVDYEGGVTSRVAMELTLVRVRDHKVLWSGTRQAQSAVQGKEVAAVVEALNVASEQVLNELLPNLVAQVEQDIQQGAKASQ